MSTHSRWSAFALRRRGAGSRFGSSVFATSTLAELAWQRTRHATRRWGWWGAAAGTLIGVIWFAPAAWLAAAVTRASDERVLLADAQGTIWSGSALPALTGGPGSRDATTLPARVHWDLRPGLTGLQLRLRQACCLNGELRLEFRLGLGRVTMVLAPQNERAGQALGQWPAAWLTGLGTPWNTLQLGGTLRLASPGLALETVHGRWRLTGGADLELLAASSRLTTLDTLGSYRLAVRSDAASGAAATLQLDTLEGALQLSGSGQWSGDQMRFRGEARAAEGQEAALANLLNIIGRRQGATSLISIG
jgi:general secretion pathway protein N